MVILITGATHTGKTMLAQRLLDKYGYPYLSMDHLKMGLIRSGQTSLTVRDDDALTAYLWPIISEMAKTAIENQQNLVIEGCYIPFNWREAFSEAYLPFIRYICLAMTDAYIAARFSDILRHGSDIEARMDETDCTAERLQSKNRAYIEGCERFGCPVTLIDGAYEPCIEGLLRP